MVQGVAEIAVQYDALEARLDALESECEALSRAIIKSGWSWSNVEQFCPRLHPHRHSDATAQSLLKITEKLMQQTALGSPPSRTPPPLMAKLPYRPTEWEKLLWFLLAPFKLEAAVWEAACAVAKHYWELENKGGEWKYRKPDPKRSPLLTANRAAGDWRQSPDRLVKERLGSHMIVSKTVLVRMCRYWKDTAVRKDGFEQNEANNFRQAHEELIEEIKHQFITFSYFDDEKGNSDEILRRLADEKNMTPEHIQMTVKQFAAYKFEELTGYGGKEVGKTDDDAQAGKSSEGSDADGNDEGDTEHADSGDDGGVDGAEGSYVEDSDQGEEQEEDQDTEMPDAQEIHSADNSEVDNDGRPPANNSDEEDLQDSEMSDAHNADESGIESDIQNSDVEDLEDSEKADDFNADESEIESDIESSNAEDVQVSEKSNVYNADGSGVESNIKSSDVEDVQGSGKSNTQQAHEARDKAKDDVPQTQEEIDKQHVRALVENIEHDYQSSIPDTNTARQEGSAITHLLLASSSEIQNISRTVHGLLSAPGGQVPAHYELLAGLSWSDFMCLLPSPQPSRWLPTVEMMDALVSTLKQQTQAADKYIITFSKISEMAEAGDFWIPDLAPDARTLLILPTEENHWLFAELNATRQLCTMYVSHWTEEASPDATLQAVELLLLLAKLLYHSTRSWVGKSHTIVGPTTIVDTATLALGCLYHYAGSPLGLLQRGDEEILDTSRRAVTKVLRAALEHSHYGAGISPSDSDDDEDPSRQDNDLKGEKYLPRGPIFRREKRRRARSSTHTAQVSGSAPNSTGASARASLQPSEGLQPQHVVAFTEEHIAEIQAGLPYR